MKRRIQRLRNGVSYFTLYTDAQNVRDRLRKDYPECRIVEYGLGYAVQYYKSGPYYPQIPDPNSRFNPHRKGTVQG